MKKWKEDRGSVVMIESTIYFPITVLLVLALVFFGMVKFQVSLLNFQAQKFALIGGREMVYPGYEVFESGGTLESSGVDFRDGTNFSDGISSYYEKACEHLYQEWKFDYSGKTTGLEGSLENVLRQKSYITGLTTSAEVSMKNNLIVKYVTVTVSYGIALPRFLSLVGVPSEMTLMTRVRETAVNPTGLVRNVDLACDFTNFLLEKLGVKNKVDSFLKKVEDIKSKIL